MRVASFNNNANSNVASGNTQQAPERISSPTSTTTNKQARRHEPFTREVLPWPVVEVPQFCREQGSFEPPEDCFIICELSDKRMLYIQANAQWTPMQLIQHMRELLIMGAHYQQDTTLPHTGYLVASNNQTRLKPEIPLDEQNIQPNNATKRNPARLLFVIPTPQQLQQEAMALAAAAASLTTTASSNNTSAVAATNAPPPSSNFGAAASQLLHHHPSSMISGADNANKFHGGTQGASSTSYHGITADAVAAQQAGAENGEDGGGQTNFVDDIDPYLKELEQKLSIPPSSEVYADLDNAIKAYIEKYQECLTDEEDEKPVTNDDTTMSKVMVPPMAAATGKKNGQRDELTEEDEEEEGLNSSLDGASETSMESTATASREEKKSPGQVGTSDGPVVVARTGRSDTAVPTTNNASNNNTLSLINKGGTTLRNSVRASDPTARGGSGLAKTGGGGSARRPSAKQQ